MQTAIEDQVVDFYDRIFDEIFSEPFRTKMTARLKRRAVVRQVEESADAASQSLTRFFLNEQLTEAQVADVLDGFVTVPDLLKLDGISNPNVTPESVVENLLPELPPPEVVRQANIEAVYRVALHSIVQVLMLVGPVMAEWGKLNFSSTFGLLRRVVNRLNQIAEQLDALGYAGQAAMDERYELTYRDYLLQRFHRVEVRTVRMTTNMDVDLRELFVMPRVLAKEPPEEGDNAELTDVTGLMDLAEARRILGAPDEYDFSSVSIEAAGKEKDTGIHALDQVKRYPRTVIVGVPGSGKSTFLEWLQLKIANAEEELIMGDQQAIPLLLRVRQLDPRNLPRGAALIQSATGSKDRAALTPDGWIDRQMEAGRVLFMLDGLDETDPELRDSHLLPWLLEVCQQYPDCRYLVSSRPVGYSPGTLAKLKFVECDLLDFNEAQITEYTRHWCTAVRLARNEPEGEARREGETDGNQIVDGFKDHLYIHNLARTPLMLSAICLVNYFEGGELPNDRALLYQLCVEGLLHNWDIRRGIHSEFVFDEKLRTCREVALAMQAADRAEYEADKVREIFAAVLGDSARAERLLEHIRYRTGLLLERRPAVFAFAHLTFQEYLTARGVHEGNQLGLDVEQLVHEHEDGRWKEIIALYCGLAPTPAARDLIEHLIGQQDTRVLSSVLAEAYLSAGTELSQDRELRRRVLGRVAIAPGDGSSLDRFPPAEVAPTANQSVGKINSELGYSESFFWLWTNSEALEVGLLAEQVQTWRSMKYFQAAELLYFLHSNGPDVLLAEIATNPDLYTTVETTESRFPLASMALAGLSQRKISSLGSSGVDATLLQIFRDLANQEDFRFAFVIDVSSLLSQQGRTHFPQETATWAEFVVLARRLAEGLASYESEEAIPPLFPGYKSSLGALNTWADSLEAAIAEREKQQYKPKTASKRTQKKSRKRR